ncbi:MAG: hypothetical protein A2687_00035 [Candidatus Levybacteria bacterium RIFCSPHIGHO2_01_FULL_38_26]|nr:MAG: hypothetical protein A2687_00035 [Candidatus Levybacteria bacterium RIFCSPHIGHO2_01_FULL_38_26]
MNKTLIYYTANRENPVFEQKVIDDMLKKAENIPIISVSQKPMDLGRNVCIGDVGFSYLNERKQILIAAKLATTEYIITSESDFLYPPQYFKFKPKGDNFYRWENIWIMWLADRKRQNFYRKRSTSDGAQIVKRDFFVAMLEKYLAPYPGWYEENDRQRDPRHSPYHRVPFTPISQDIPCVSIKSNFGLTYLTGVNNTPEGITKNLPYWGDVSKLRAKFS